MQLKITTLIENQPAQNPELKYEHGLSFYIEVEGKKILFDTGQTGDFVENAELLQKDLGDLDYVFISHGHFDHANGLPRLLDKLNPKTNIVIGEEFFRKKYKVLEDGTYIYGGVSFEEKDVVEKGFELTKIKTDIYPISEKIMIFHHFERSNEVEQPNPIFVIKDEQGECLDEFPDEIAMGIVTDKGLVVVVGCSHFGIANILTHIQKKTNMPIYAVIGGTHLVEADDKRVEYTMDTFRKLGIQLIAVSHCTGQSAIQKMDEFLGENFIINNTGNIMIIETE